MSRIRVRHQIGVTALAIGAIALPAVALAASGSSAGHAAAAAAPQCRAAQLEIWYAPSGAAAGTAYYQLELSNVSARTCTVYGFPGVSAVAGRQLGSPAQRNRAHPIDHVTLPPGATAHTVLQIADVWNFTPSQCKPATATALRVYPPDQLSAAEIPFSFRACSAKGPIFLSVEPIQPGVGVPGYPS